MLNISAAEVWVCLYSFYAIVFEIRAKKFWTYLRRQNWT